jgi:hypothetical protein
MTELTPGRKPPRITKGVKHMQLTVNLDDALVAGLTKHGEPPHGFIVEEELRNHDKLLCLGLNEIRGMFTQDEICLIADACNGYWYSPDNPKLQLFLEVSDGIELNGLDEKWDVEKKELLRKLASLSQFHAHAVLAVVIKCWDMSDNVDNKLVDLLVEHFMAKSPKE